MTATVEIRTGQRRVLDVLLDPIRKYANNGMTVRRVLPGMRPHARGSLCGGAHRTFPARIPQASAHQELAAHGRRDLEERPPGVADRPNRDTSPARMAGDPQALAAMRQAGAHGNPLALALLAEYEGFRHPHMAMLPPAQQRSVLAVARAAADAGDPIGQFIYGQELEAIGQLRHDASQLATGERLIKAAIPRLRHAAHGNACPALYQFWLADAYGGAGVAKDLPKYVRWSRRAAEGGNVVAQGAVGFAYTYGVGTAQDCTEGLKWVQQSAQANYPKSQVLLGIMHERGLCVAHDPTKAVALFRTAAKAKEVSAYANLGMAYIDGKGVPQDGIKGLDLLLRAATEDTSQPWY